MRCDDDGGFDGRRECFDSQFNGGQEPLSLSFAGIGVKTLWVRQSISLKTESELNNSRHKCINFNGIKWLLVRSYEIHYFNTERCCVTAKTGFLLASSDFIDEKFSFAAVLFIIFCLSYFIRPLRPLGAPLGCVFFAPVKHVEMDFWFMSESPPFINYSLLSFRNCSYLKWKLWGKFFEYFMSRAMWFGYDGVWREVNEFWRAKGNFQFNKSLLLLMSIHLRQGSHHTARLPLQLPRIRRKSSRRVASLQSHHVRNEFSSRIFM